MYRESLRIEFVNGRAPGQPCRAATVFSAGEAVERLEALLAAVAGVADAAEGQLDAAAGAVVVDEDLAGAERCGRAASAGRRRAVQTPATRP